MQVIPRKGHFVFTAEKAIQMFGVEIDPHLARDVEIPVLTGVPQRQGDVLALWRPNVQKATTEVPSAGVAVVRGEAGGNTHSLHGFGKIYFDGREASSTNLTLGTLTVPEGSVAYLGHPEHGYMGFGPGNWVMRRQREQADEIRMVAD